MSRPTLVLFLVLVLLGVLVWRETRFGTLVGWERGAARWVAQAAGMKNLPDLLQPPTLVFYGGWSGERVEALEIGLFARAARLLGARVAAVAVFDFPASEIRLALPASASGPHYIGGTLLLERPSQVGLAPRRLPPSEGQGWRLEQFRGAFSAFPAGEGWQGGFVNLPTRTSAAGNIVLVAEWGETPVASLALAAHLAAQESLAGHEAAQPLRFRPGEGLQIGGWLLPLADDGSLPLRRALLPSLRRLDLEELLLEAERMERGLAADPQVLRGITGRTVLFGALADAGLRGPGGRQFSLVEFHGLGLASLQAALAPMPAPWWGELGAFLFALGAVLLCRRSAVGRRWAAYLGWLAAWVALVLALAAHFELVLPLLFPLALILTGWLVSPLFPAQTERQPSILAGVERGSPPS